MSNETAQIIDSEIKRLVEEGYAQAKRLLTDNVGQLKLLAEGLLEYETLSGEEIRGLLDGIAPDRSGIDLNKPKAPSAGGSSIPKTRRPGGFGDAKPQGA